MATFQSKVIAITGGASGMGLATAKLLAARGAILCLADINEAALQEAASSVRDAATDASSNYQQNAETKVLCTVVDVRRPASVDDWIAQTVQQLGRLDGVVNMAGIIAPAAPIVDLAGGEWERTMAVNCSGMFYCLRAQLRAMERGSIVCTASTFGQFGAAGNAAYCASKAAVINLARTAAKENPNIRINCVSPGSVNTPLSQGENPEDVKRELQVTVQKRRAEPEEVATVVAFLLGDEASFVTGAVYNVDGGWVC